VFNKYRDTFFSFEHSHTPYLVPMLYVQFKKVQIRDYEYLLCNQLYHKLVENGRNVDYTECYGSPCNTFHLITKRIFLNKHFSDIDLF
jgi:hypothetical protein